MKKRVIFLLVCLSTAWAAVLSQVIEAPAQGRFRPEMVLPSHYPEAFDGFGRVDRIDTEAIVINDRHLRLSSRFTYATKQSHRAPRELIREGDIVGFTLNSRKEVTGVYLLGSSAP